MTLVAYRLLGAVPTAMPSELSKFEFAIDWSAEVGIRQKEPVIVHVIDDGSPVYFNYAVSHHFGKKRDTFSADVQDLSDTYCEVMQRVCEHIMLVAQFHAKIDQTQKVAA